MRRTPFAPALIGVVLLAGGLIVTAEAVAQEQTQRASMSREAEQVAANFDAYLDRAKGLDLLQAQNPSFASTPLTRKDLAAANKALTYLEVLYPSSIGETCLIDERGGELARVVNGSAAAPADLSSDESHNPFFAPTLALPVGQVLQEPPYVSPDTHQWVISNSTWIRRPDGRRLIVHFEVALASFQSFLQVASPQMHAAIVDQRTGQIFLQDDGPLPSSVPQAPFPSATWSTRLAALGAGHGKTVVKGHAGQFQRVGRAIGNSDWYAVRWTTERPSLVPPWAGGAAALVGALLVAFALATFHRQQTTLRAAARLDHLTGLANRKALEEALDEALERGVGSAEDRIGVLLLDLDGFKQINDSLGHDRGDLVLQEIARRLHASVFEYDTAARLGGDEFAIVLRRLRSAEDVSAVAHRIRDALVRPIHIDGVPRFVGASVGAATYPEHGATAVELLRSADSAMYQAKRGREGVRVYQLGTQAGAERLGLAAALLTAIEEDRIDLAFQPEYSLATDRIVGVEALARWESADGPVSPNEFVALAEETGLIRSLTLLTLRQALDEALVWRTMGAAVPISVNLSARVLGDRSLVTDILALLAERSLPGSSLVVEVTETAVINDRTVAVEMLNQLRGEGVRVELDDFGSGYASFAALHDLPLDGVKIDRDLVFGQSNSDGKLLAATVELGHSLGLVVVAEGIENGDMLATVRRLGCDSAQGYHLARPMTAGALGELIAQQDFAGL